ncbi:hypothetical protein DXG01_007789 [Tephrocybe rancida]|nr:hypothetical protein DXG01_007789 [Tephrocybe rancida]
MAYSLPDAALQKLQEPRGRSTTSHFTLSVPGSENSSREPSPAPSLKRNGYPASLRNLDEKDPTPGRLPMDVYDVTLPWWRAGIRRKLVTSVQWESEIIAKLQNLIRTPWLDAYFVYTSSLGTHTFFMTVLPALFFFGHSEMGRGLILVLAFGVYFSSFIKDLICSPRPFAPPVTRLTIGSHHLEYGFPSTHSTNCVSIALFFFGHVHRLASTPDAIISDKIYTLITIGLSIYTFSIVFGRIYTAMHSFTDCAVGVALGSGIWWIQSSWAGIPIVLASSNPLYWLTGNHIFHLGKGLGGGEWVEQWVRRGGWEVPLILIPLCLLAVNQHPQPIDDCPCFEDAIAFGSVVLGALVASWAMSFFELRMEIGKSVVMPGSGWVFELGQWVQIERTMWDVVLWWSFAALKMVVGILVIFVWRLLAKSALHLILPPTFRGLARVFSLPNRRFYTPATDYKSVPSEFSGDGIHPIPSVIDLPSSAGVGIEVGGIGSGVSGASAYASNGIKLRGNGSSEKGGSEQGQYQAAGAVPELGEKNKDVKHYDADVLTKVVVYAGIAVLACEALPAMFEMLGWGVFLLALLLSSSMCLGAPHFHKRAPNPTRVCGVNISPSKLAAAERRFSANRLPPSAPNATASIDVHFHVVSANTTLAGGYVPDSQIQAQIDVLNMDYAETGIKWNLVNTTRIQSQEWFDSVGPESPQNTALKTVFRYGNESTLNVYTVGFVKNIEAQGLLGYATFPADYKSAPKDDGVVIRYSSLPNGTAAPFNLGRTLTHEVGHWVGLYHTFQGGCEGSGDSVDDTAPEASPASGCPLKRDTCPGGDVDPVQNFMDYTDDSCMTGFTPGQATRMKAQIRTYRGIKI